jgi:CheY-like chemotaxis protein
MKKILIVEDQDEVRKMLSIALKRATHITLEASNGLAALHMIKEQQPVVVLLDVKMPGALNGFQVCEMIKEDAQTRDTFVILTSGLNEEKDFDEARRVGADAYCVKPFRLSRLVEIVMGYRELAGTFVLEKTPTV